MSHYLPRRSTDGPCGWPARLWLAALLLGLGCGGDSGLEPDFYSGSVSNLSIQLIGPDTVDAELGRPVEDGVRIRVVGPQGEPVARVRLEWRVVSGGGTVVPPVSLTSATGTAEAGWLLGPRLGEPQTLEVSVAGGVSRLVYALPALPGNISLDVGAAPGAADTIGATLSDVLRLQLRLPDSRPIVGAPVRFTVTSGGGAAGDTLVYSDSTGVATTSWMIGDSAGLQAAQAEVVGSGAANARQTFTVLALPGQPAAIMPGVDTLRFSALGDTLQPPVVVRDRAGNVASVPVVWQSLTPQVAGGLQEAGVIAVGNGSGLARVAAGRVSALVPVVVNQVPDSIDVVQASVALAWLGATARLEAQVYDRRRNVITGAAPAWSSTAPGVAAVDSLGQVTAIGTGMATVRAQYASITDSATVRITQYPAAIQVSPVLDTLDLDSLETPTVVVRDSGGSVIPSPALHLTLSDSSIVGERTGGVLQGTLPGITDITYDAGPVNATITRVVEGVAVLVDGERETMPTSLSGRPAFTITNGRIRISWSTAMWEIASVEMDVRLGRAWVPANARRWGDWVYIAASVRTLPTAMEILENGTDRVAVRMEFEDHWFRPDLDGFAPKLGLVPQPYPFHRTVWVRKGDNGYYSWVDLFKDLGLNIVEHETGFGGLWGPATMRTSQLTLRTDTLSGTITYNGNPGIPANMGSRVDAVEFSLDGDPVRRLLVPLPEAPFITPVFPGWGYGSVYRYASPSRSFGVYMYAGAYGPGAPTASAVCTDAWTNAPFLLRSVSAAELAGCGPATP